MPAGDQTGPMGLGAMTGRGAGHCASASGRGQGRGMGFNRGRGMGRGQGFGFKQGFMAPLTREEQIESLNTQAAGLELQLKTLTEQIGKLEAE